MAKQKICLDCGTEYSAQELRCPLCGSSQWEPAPEAPEVPVSSGRDQASAPAEKKKKPAREVDDGMPKSLVIASTVLVFLAVLAMGWHILAQWIPSLPSFGSSDSVSVTDPSATENQPTSPTQEDQSCWYLNCEQKTLTFNEAGQSATLKIDTEPKPCSDPVVFTAADPAVATVDEQGKVTAVAEGDTSVRITCGAMSLNVSVTCKFGVPILPKLSQTEVSFTELGQTQTITVENLSDGQSVSWRTSSTAVATVDLDGCITAVGPGSCTVTAQIDAQTLTVDVEVALADVTTGTVTAESLRLRSEANTDCEVLANLVEGDQLVILGHEDGWYHVQFDGMEGYVSDQYVDTEE